MCIPWDVGRGAFGAAILVNHKTEKKKYVLKKIRLTRQTDRCRKSAHQEMALIACLQHPYTVEFKEAWVEKLLTTCIPTMFCTGTSSAQTYFSQKIMTSVLTLPFEATFSVFTNEVIWLIVISFFFARGFAKTGLGNRIATYFIKWLGGTTLGLSYGLTVSEACIASAMLSTTARAGGIFLPIIKSLALSAGSKPNDQSSRKLGSYLVMTQFQKKSDVVLENNSRLEEQMADPSTSSLPEGHRMGLGGMDEKGRDVAGAYEVGGGRWATGVE
ncbi:hypothetical protein ZWY2020_036125 [Hordeum vulgare]|nr:hypothetical protein ZWY2020_036125 [Hordeum vulgare]